MLGYIACFALSVGPVTWVILSEIFPTKIRGRAMAIATFCLWVANFIVSQTFPMMDENPWLVEHFHHGFPFWIYAAFCVVLVLVMWRPSRRPRANRSKKSNSIDWDPSGAQHWPRRRTRNLPMRGPALRRDRSGTASSPALRRRDGQTPGHRRGRAAPGKTTSPCARRSATSIADWRVAADRRAAARPRRRYRLRARRVARRPAVPPEDDQGEPPGRPADLRRQRPCALVRGVSPGRAPRRAVLPARRRGARRADRLRHARAGRNPASRCSTRRGIQPFHDFPEGPDWWNADDYKAILGQLPKLRMNFFGLHTYPEGGVGPEPRSGSARRTTSDADGTVKSAIPRGTSPRTTLTGEPGATRRRRPATTPSAPPRCSTATTTAPDYMQGTSPWTDSRPSECNALFNRMGEMLGDAFRFARRLGVKTCVGTETPLIDSHAGARSGSRRAGKDPADPAVVQELYEGMFQRIAKTHPLDYYWFWTPEGWTWEAVEAGADRRHAGRLLQAAMAAAEEGQAPRSRWPRAAGCSGRRRIGRCSTTSCPRTCPMSCINREVGHTPVEPGFAKVEGPAQVGDPVDGGRSRP